MAGVFDEARMRQMLGEHIPEGETLLAGIHAVAKETQVRGVFGKCICAGDRLIPEETGGTVALSKTKYSTYDLYIGITRSFLVMADCEENQALYQVDDEPDLGEADVREVSSEILLSELGTCVPLADIRSCEIKKGWMGSINCMLAMKNGSYFKLMFPKLGGLGGGMPHHAEYREAIVTALSGRRA